MEERLDIMHGDEGEVPGIEAYPEWLQKRLEWFQDLKFGLFLHWGGLLPVGLLRIVAAGTGRHVGAQRPHEVLDRARQGRMKDQ